MPFEKMPGWPGTTKEATCEKLVVVRLKLKTSMQF